MTPPSLLAFVDDYVALRRGLGFGVEKLRWLLRDFARYAERVGHHGPITVDLAVRWAVSSCPGDPARTERLSAALDLVYCRGGTRWVRALRAAGIPAHDGREMLVQQGVAAFGRFFPDHAAPVEVMRAAVNRALRA